MTTFHGIKTPDGLGLFCVLEGAAPAGLPAEQFWPVNGEVPDFKSLQSDFQVCVCVCACVPVCVCVSS